MVSVSWFNLLIHNSVTVSENTGLETIEPINRSANLMTIPHSLGGCLVHQELIFVQPMQLGLQAILSICMESWPEAPLLICIEAPSPEELQWPS